jgi:hypothetical protein
MAAPDTQMSSGPGTPLEVSQTFSPLGIQFWDMTQNLPVVGGLSVNLRLANSIAPALPAVLTSSGVYGFFGLPGLFAAEHPGPEGYGPPRTFRYVVTVQDLLGRFLPVVLVYTLDQTGALVVAGSQGALRAPLFSAVSRPVPPGVGAIRADLLDEDTGQPATWAVVRIQIAGETETWTGIADANGRVMVLVPYPVMRILQLGSPPGTGQGSFAAQSWPVTVTVQYSPDQLSYPAADFPDAAWPWTSTPNLKDILGVQQPATIWANLVAPESELTTNLIFREDLLLASLSGSLPSPQSTLSISRAGSPP